MTRRVWSDEQVRALGVRVDLVTACDVVLGCGRTKAYELQRRGELPFPTLRVGQRIVVPTAPLLALLGLTPNSSAGRPTSRPVALTHQSPPEGPDVPNGTKRPLRSA